MSGRYMFASQPRAVSRNRKKYRGDEAMVATVPNIMFDRRIARGTTVAKPVQKTQGEGRGGASQRARRKKRGEDNSDAGGETEALVHPRKLPTAAHIHSTLRYVRERVELPISQYLEEQVQPKQVTSEYSQTDKFIEEPRPVPYIPMKTGLDAGTQVETEYVFDYDRDVNPILEVLVGKTIEQSLMEVVQEEQEMALKKKRRTLLDHREKYEEQVAKLESDEAALRLANKKLVDQKREENRREIEVKNKNMATAFAMEYLSGLEDEVFDQLEEQKVFINPVERKIETDFMPWVFDESRKRLSAIRAGNAAVEELVKVSLQMGIEERKKAEGEAPKKEKLWQCTVLGGRLQDW
uniref:Radial spoke protein 3 n=1 Tax=Lotharella globosa TaxID=91324 RepID=A0A7S3ZCT2_9EUKA